MAKYEILYIIRPNIEEEAKNALVARFDFDRLSKINGDILRHMIVKVDA